MKIEPADLTAFNDLLDERKAREMIVDAMALASAPWVAPCIYDEDFAYPDQAKAIIRGAILRWADAGTGAITQLSAGSIQQTVDNRTERKRVFWPSEIVDLQRLCKGARAGTAFSIDTLPRRSP
ncbi:hypothetical protein DW322_21330 [Rhodococcus rhodnii]|uniref:Head-to-tail adaptor n=1 Tax=Rhodococcus rhodnii TaxID=38312 RepID=A0A6P2CDE8_9NOCA|nr:hypothetical protein DW322_21410 [Rhodococcus rhodnii]TXG92272.1 hypothetical protein DW322_00915 [Rhodococcus rhodnii]TXG92965.1 hypothetical protein DW322_21330 [Rhodococcus rhodnii]